MELQFECRINKNRTPSDCFLSNLTGRNGRSAISLFMQNTTHYYALL